MNAHNEQQALPCPFCGAEPDLSFNSVSCGCAASPFIDREDALQVWNTRAAQPAAAQEAVAWQRRWADDGLWFSISKEIYEATKNGKWADRYEVRALYAAPVTAAQEVVAYLDIGAGGYLDIGSDLPEEQLLALPNGRHALGIIGTYGIDGYVSAPVTAAQADADPFGQESYKRMLVAACSALAEVSRELGCDPEQGGAEPILEAIAKLKASPPAAPGIDLRQFRDAVVAWSDKAYEESHNPEHPTIQKADRLLALIDASPMGAALNERFGSAEGLGGSEARDAARYRWLREFAVNGSIGIPFHGWLNCDEPASEWDSAIDAAMQAGDAEVQP